MINNKYLAQSDLNTQEKIGREVRAKRLIQDEMKRIKAGSCEQHWGNGGNHSINRKYIDIHNAIIARCCPRHSFETQISFFSKAHETDPGKNANEPQLFILRSKAKTYLPFGG